MNTFPSYLAGLIDGDGSITISITTTKTKNPSIIFTFQIRIALKENDSKYLEKIHQMIGVGKMYYSNKGKPEGVCSWQTTNISDAIIVGEIVQDHLIIKKDKCRRFLECARFWHETMTDLDGKRVYGKRLRTKEEIIGIMKVALDLNFDRQTVRYRDRKGWDHWKKIIDKLY